MREIVHIQAGESTVTLQPTFTFDIPHNTLTLQLMNVTNCRQVNVETKLVQNSGKSFQMSTALIQLELIMETLIYNLKELMCILMKQLVAAMCQEPF